MPNQGPIQWTRSRIPWAGRFIEIREIRNVDDLLDRLTPEERSDERMPYFGELWPASIGLARWMGKHLKLEGCDVLVLGCGVGLEGIAAALLGGRVCFSDYFPEALELARANAKRNGCRDGEFLELDWRDETFSRRFDVILGSDLLYEARCHDPVRAVVRRCLAPGGTALIADPCRPNADPFFEGIASAFRFEEHRVAVEHRKAEVKIRIVKVQWKENGGVATG